MPKRAAKRKAKRRAAAPEKQPAKWEPQPNDGYLYPLLDLKPDTHFVEPVCQIEGVLIHVNQCRARVRLLRGSKEVTIGDRTFTATKARETDWTPLVGVRILEPLTGDDEMAKKKVTAEKTKKESVKCGCGCGQMTKPGSKFLQGHDARFHGRARKLADGRLSLADLTKELGKQGTYALASYKEAAKHFPSTPPTKKKATAKKTTAKKKTTKRK